MGARSRGKFSGSLGVLQVPEAADRQNIALPDINKSAQVADFVVGGVYKNEKDEKKKQKINFKNAKNICIEND